MMRVLIPINSRLVSYTESYTRTRFEDVLANRQCTWTANALRKPGIAPSAPSYLHIFNFYFLDCYAELPSAERVRSNWQNNIPGCSSFGSKVPPSSEQSVRRQRVNSLQTARREELLVDSVNLAEGVGIAVTARASERITPPNRSVSAK